MTTDGEGSASPPRSRFGWVRAASDRIPTRWFAGIGTGLFLAATAAFGGLATAGTPSITEMEAGDEHRTDQRAMTVDRAVLVDEFPEAGVFVDDGERVLALLLSVENAWDEPLAAAPDSSVIDSVTVEDLRDPPDTVARYDDATINPVLQPGVPAQIVLAWAVDAEAFADAQDLTLTLKDMTLYTGSFVANGQWWTDPVASATVTVSVEDIGAGG